MENITFTADEQTFIDDCFAMTLGHFASNPLDKDNQDDIRKAVNYRNYNIGSIGVRNHEIMHGIFAKMGYCNDGRTTLDEQAKREELDKLQDGQVWSDKKEKLLIEINKKIASLEEIKAELESHDKNFDKESKQKLKIAQDEMKVELKAEKVASQRTLLTEAAKSIDKMNLRELRILAKAKNIKNYSRMNKADLKAMVEAA